ncbi:hypothetical protein [Yoonia maritima]|uniref:hypothetical protein n=1 Tax=Yoonia maritima TaxID=1435347 RepID=UPI003735BBB7
MAFRNFLDGAASFCAALVTSAVCGLPTWFTVVAVRAEVAPIWAYAAAAGLAFVGVILTIAFLRKAFAGVAPTRHRRR